MNVLFTFSRLRLSKAHSIATTSMRGSVTTAIEKISTLLYDRSGELTRRILPRWCVCVGSARKNNSLQCCTCTYDRLEIILFMRFEFNFETHAEALSQSNMQANKQHRATDEDRCYNYGVHPIRLYMYVHISHNSDTTIANPPT